MAILGVPLMRILMWVAMAGLLLLILFAGLFVFLVNDFGGEDTVQAIGQYKSPDGKVIAEIQEVIAPMHGGSDTIQVTIQHSGLHDKDVVYSRVYGCTLDYSAYHLAWRSSNELVVTYGSCDGGRWHGRDDNKVLRQQGLWRGIRIDYRDSGYIARGTR